jgi:Domain of unknown function (DUF4189)
MKTLIKKSPLVLFTLLAATQVCWAGWGAIACSNNNGSCTWTEGAFDYQTAVDEAVTRCDEEYGNCTMRKWENNSCVSEVASNGNVAQACY